MRTNDGHLFKRRYYGIVNNDIIPRPLKTEIDKNLNSQFNLMKNQLTSIFCFTLFLSLISSAFSEIGYGHLINLKRVVAQSSRCSPSRWRNRTDFYLYLITQHKRIIK